MPNSDISPGLNVRRIFLLGDSTPINDDNPQATILSKRHEALLIEEQREYGDILQGEFHDSFRNLTLKEIMFLNWLPRHCPRTQFIFKVKSNASQKCIKLQYNFDMPFSFIYRVMMIFLPIYQILFLTFKHYQKLNNVKCLSDLFFIQVLE